jgi:hypothetical protein
VSRPASCHSPQEFVKEPVRGCQTLRSPDENPVYGGLPARPAAWASATPKRASAPGVSPCSGSARTRASAARAAALPIARPHVTSTTPRVAGRRVATAARHAIAATKRPAATASAARSERSAPTAHAGPSADNTARTASMPPTRAALASNAGPRTSRRSADRSFAGSSRRLAATGRAPAARASARDSLLVNQSHAAARKVANAMTLAGSSLVETAAGAMSAMELISVRAAARSGSRVMEASFPPPTTAATRSIPPIQLSGVRGACVSNNRAKAAEHWKRWGGQAG